MTIAPCTHKRVHHDHGSDGRYRADGCRCPLCKRANARTEKARRLRALTGQRSIVPAEPVRRHVVALIESGMSIRGLARQSGLAFEAVRNVVDGNRDTVRVKTARALMSVQPAILPGAAIDSSGSVRRLQALAVLGWSATALGELLGMHEDSVKRITRGAPRIERVTDDKIRALYRRIILEEQAPAGRPSSITGVRSWAARNGWVGPMAWDDIDNDDAPADTTPYRPATKPQQARELADMGLEDLQIAARLGVKPYTVRDYLKHRSAA